MLDENVEFLMEVYSETPGLQKTTRKFLTLEPDTIVLERNQQEYIVFASDNAFPKREYILKPHSGPQQRAALYLYSI
jgi:hypothetical protein